MHELGLSVGLCLEGDFDSNSNGRSMGFARLAETAIRRIRGKTESDYLGPMDKIIASSIGGALATWNQPIEVVRIEVSGHP